MTFLIHQDGDEKLRNDSIGDPLRVRPVSRHETHEHGHFGCESDIERPSVDGEELVGDVPDRLGVLLDKLLIEITLPVEDLAFDGDILRVGHI